MVMISPLEMATIWIVFFLTVLDRCVTKSDAVFTWEVDLQHAELAVTSPTSRMKKTVFGGPKENEVRKALRRAIKAFGKVDLHLKRQGHGSKRKGGAYPQTGFVSLLLICVSFAALHIEKKGCLSCMVTEHNPLPP